MGQNNGNGSAGAGTGVVDRREAERLEAIERWRVLQAPPDCFQQIAELAAKIFDVPIACVTVIDKDRVWFPARTGVPAEWIPRTKGICCSVVKTGEPLFLPDARLHADSMQNPLVSGDFNLRFYAGVPLRTSDGHAVGTLAVGDHKPREISQAEEEILTDLADLAGREIEVRLAARETVSLEQEEAEQVKAKAENLRAAMGTHGVIGQAMGILMAERGFDSDAAFGALREVSQHRNVKLAEVAQKYVSDFDDRARAKSGQTG